MAFVGIGLECGQVNRGLSLSSHRARSFLNSEIQFSDYGDIGSTQKYKKIFNYSDLDQFDLSGYVHAAQIIRTALATHEFTLNWGGDHSIGWATISAFLSLYPNGKVIWIDAHADLNRPDTSPTGSFHGMPVSFLLGLNNYLAPKELSYRLSPDQLIYVGLRSLDPFETEAINHLGIRTFDSNYIKEFGMNEVISEIRNLVKFEHVHISFDIDSLDPDIAPSTGVPVPAGLAADDIFQLADYLAAETKYTSLDIVEINPLIGTVEEVNRTFNLGFSFLKKFIPQQRSEHAFQLESNQGTVPVATEWGL